jgi:hypothetical protein
MPMFHNSMKTATMYINEVFLRVFQANLLYASELIITPERIGHNLLRVSQNQLGSKFGMLQVGLPPRSCRPVWDIKSNNLK